MNKNDLILKIANSTEGDPVLQRIATALNGDSDDGALLTAAEACQFLKISRSSLWRHFKPALKIGSLPRWKKGELLANGGAQ